MQPRRMLIGIITGIVLGLAAKLFAADAAWLAWVINNVATPIGQIFLRLLFMLVVPLLFSALVVGVTGIELRDLGRLGGRTLLYTVVVTAVGVTLGLVLVNVIRPGEIGHTESLKAMAAQQAGAPTVNALDKSAAELIVSMVPRNAVEAAATGDMIGVIVFALVFGIALAVTRTPAAMKFQEMIQGLYDVMMTCIDGVLRLAPLGVGALLFTMAARLGTGLIVQLGAYVGVVVLGLALQMVVVYSFLLRVVAGRSPMWFFRGAKLAIITAFSTSSSSASLPTALKVADEDLRLPTSVSRFVLTVGASMNQNGTALFEGVTVLFLAQVYGVHLGLGDQALIMFISILAGVGTAGVPAGSLPAIAMILTMFKIPVEGLALILGVDRLLDMCRTTLNVTGDLVAAVVLSGRRASSDDQSRPQTSAPSA
jgi:dicarboxylate/amino acid:cation (Na+ or H+) symporter, DAACS family